VNDKPRILILWNHLPSYLAACVKILLDEWKASVFVVVRTGDRQANERQLLSFSNFQFFDLSSSSADPIVGLNGLMREYRPDLVLAGSPKWGPFAALARSTPAMTVAAADHYWKGTWRDYANMLCGRLGIAYRGYDAIWMPGILGRHYARRLGFDDSRIFEGVLSCDTSIFREVGRQRFASGNQAVWPRVFLYVGRYITLKNLDRLLRAYGIYRAGASEPWELWCAGEGPMKTELEAADGVRDCGYQNPERCARLMAQAGAFVLPSRYDHWGVVIHEAACAGLPILASQSCGAATHLVRDGYNGYTFPAEDVETLAVLMQRISDSKIAQAMGHNSLRMSYQFDPKLWAKTLMEDIPSCVRE